MTAKQILVMSLRKCSQSQSCRWIGEGDTCGQCGKPTRPIPNKQAAKVAERALAVGFPSSSCGRLWYSVIAVTVMDAFTATSRAARLEAIDYLLQDEIEAASWCGVDSDWIRRIISALGFDLQAERDILRSYKKRGEWE